MLPYSISQSGADGNNQLPVDLYLRTPTRHTSSMTARTASPARGDTKAAQGASPIIGLSSRYATGMWVVSAKGATKRNRNRMVMG